MTELRASSSVGRGVHARKRAAETPLPIPHSECFHRFDIGAYPHIFSRILDYSSSHTATVIARCSLLAHKIAAEKLYRTLRVTAAALGRLIRIGCNGYNPFRPLGAGETEEPPSPSLKRCFQSVRTLYLLDYHPKLPLPRLPQGCFTHVVQLFLHLHSDALLKEFTLRPELGSVNPSHLLTRLRDSHIHSSYGRECVTHVHALPKSYRQISLLVPISFRLEGAPSCELDDGDTSVDREIAVVLLPWTSAHDDDEATPSVIYRRTLESSMSRRWTFDTSPASYKSPKHRIHLVGAEHAGIDIDPLQLLLPIPHAGNSSDKAAQLLSFGLFGDWLDRNNELLSEDEHRTLWTTDFMIATRWVSDCARRVSEELRAWYAELEVRMIRSSPDQNIIDTEHRLADRFRRLGWFSEVHTRRLKMEGPRYGFGLEDQSQASAQIQEDSAVNALP